MSLEFHPFAEVFPLLPDGELAELAEDIKVFGLREPIWLYEGKILDGRNRWLACQKARKEPQYRTFKGTQNGALALVVSNNIHRRQLTVEQRAMAAARIATLRQGGDQKTINSARATLTQAEAAEKFDVSPDSVKRARKVIEQGSKPLQKAVESGDVSLKKAAAVTSLPKPKQLAAAKAKAPKREATEPEPPADLGEFIAPADVEREEQEYRERMERVIASDDKLAQMAAELKRAAQEIVALKQARDRYMNEAGAMRRQLTAKDREIARLKKAAA